MTNLQGDVVLGGDVFSYSLKDLSILLDAELHGDGQAIVTGLASIENASASQLAFVASKKYKSQLSESKAIAVVLPPELVEFCPANALIVSHAERSFAKLTALFNDLPNPKKDIHPSAVLGDNVVLGKDVCVQANAVIENNACIGDNVIIGSGSIVGDGAKVGDNTRLHANVTVYHNVRLGSDCIVHSGTVLGSDGFGFVPNGGEQIKLHQLGTLVIGNNVEFGANCTIDRGALSDTVIADGVKMDNQVHIAHNVKVGRNTMIAGCVGVAGSTTIGENCQFGGMVGINGHIEISDNVAVTGMSLVAKSLSTPGLYSGNIPATENRLWRKNVAQFKKLSELAKLIKKS